MADHLRSVHLDQQRRQEFRLARAKLLGACGPGTARGEAAWGSAAPATVPNAPDRQPAEGEHWLADGDDLYPLKVGVNTIGRLKDNDIVIPSAFVSRRHCAILVHADDGCELHDTASKNGTFLNGQRLTDPTLLASGDEIRMCDRQLVFISRGGSAKPGQAGSTLAS